MNGIADASRHEFRQPAGGHPVLGDSYAEAMQVNVKDTFW